MKDCIFCQIVAGTIPATRVYEDEAVLAFMDIGPLVQGHTLVIPKQHCDPLTAAPPELLARLIGAVQRIARAQLNGLKADGVNIHQANGAAAGQVVPHLHFHVVPRFRGDGHHWNWTARKYGSMEEMKQLAERIKAALEA